MWTGSASSSWTERYVVGAGSNASIAGQNESPAAMAQTVERPRGLKRLAFFTIMMVIACTFSLGILELALRVYYTDRQSSNWTAFHDMRGWSLVPGHYWVKPLQRLTSFPVNVNAFGLRDLDAPPRPAGAPKLVVLGDSFTFAKETRTEKMFTRQLQDLLDKRSPAVEVLNAGVPGYGTAQQLLLEQELRDQHGVNGRVYLLVFFTNDILDNLRLSYGNLAPQPVRPGFVVAEDGRPVLESRPEKRFDPEDDTLAENPASRGLRTLSIGKAIGEEWLQSRPSIVKALGRIGIKTQIARMPAILNGWYRDDVTPRGTVLTRALLRQLNDDVKSHGGKLLVSMVPSPIQVYPDTYVPMLQKSFPGDPVIERFVAEKDRPERLVREICVEAGIPFQDLLSVFLQHNDQSLFIPRDGHLNDAGHSVVGRSLFDFVTSHWPESADSEARIHP